MSDTAIKQGSSLSYRDFPGWYRELNMKSREREQSIDWPDARQEKWRRTDLKRIDLEHHFTEDSVEPLTGGAGFRTLQTPGPNDRNMRYSTLQDALIGDFPGTRELLENVFESADNRFVYRLLSEAPSGWYFYLPRNYTPSDILFLEDRIKSDSCGGDCDCGNDSDCDCEAEENTEHFSLNLVVLEEGAQAELWERISQEPKGSVFHTRGTLFLVKKNANLRYYRTQILDKKSQLFDFSRALVCDGGEFYSWQAESSLALNKSSLTSDLKGSHSRAELKGIYHCKENGFNEIFTEQIHRAPKCISHALFRGVLEDNARTVYNGMIKVYPEAVQTDAYLTNNNLLMNDGCRADSIPGLKIETNDVKCSHGSTTGKVDQSQIFYLKSRGFSKEEAKSMLTQAFLGEVLDDLPKLVKNEVERYWDLEWEDD